MAKTAEQKTADEELSQAVEKAMVAYGFRQEAAVTAGFVVLVEQRIYPTDGDDPITGICRLYSDGDMPWVQILGLLRAATLNAEADYLTPDQD